VTDHVDGREFRNVNPAGTAGRSFGDFVNWQRTSRRQSWPRRVDNRALPELPTVLAPGEVAITFITHLTYLLQFRGLNVLTDPVYAERASPFQWTGPRRVRAPGRPFSEVPHIDVVLVSHNHYDHLGLHTLQRLDRAHRPLFITGLGNGAFLEEHGMGRVRELDWWDAVDHAGHRYTYTPAQHWSGRALSGRNRTLWGGFVVEADGRRLHFAGDSGYCEHFRQICLRFCRIDVALVPIGAYEPRWFMRDQHMVPEEAVRAHLDLEATLSIGTHYGCFQLTDEGIDEPGLALEAARRRHRVHEERFLALETGATLRIGP
jgi:L-ascorbate metabolism protein UlaG (beta-lactamase superfamily)